jgi:hypothetical protein
MQERVEEVLDVWKSLYGMGKAKGKGSKGKTQGFSRWGSVEHDGDGAVVA